MTQIARKKVLLIAHDVVGPKMAGPGIRYYQLARQLSQDFDVTLAIPNDAKLTGEPFKCVQYTAPESFPPLIDQTDVIVAQLLEPANIHYAFSLGKTLIYDFYNLIPLEYLGSLSSGFDANAADRLFLQLLTDYQLFLRSGQYFICSNDRQADCVVGMLTANQALIPSLAQGKSWHDLIGLVPFGLDSTPPRHTKKVMKSVIPGVGVDDFVIVWAGGIWDWFDPLSLIEAMAVIKDHADIKLVFLGTENPNPEVGRTKMTEAAIKLADKLSLTDKNVFFLPGWIEFKDRANYLLEADAAASIHLNTIETRYSFRTRLLDHFWAGLPSIVTQGDWLADYIGRGGLGEVVPYRDPAAISRAILKLKKDPKYRGEMKQRIAETAKHFSWQETSRDLIEFIKRPHVSKPQSPEVLHLIATEQKLREENQFMHQQLDQVTYQLDESRQNSTNLRRDLDAILNSRKWKLVQALPKLGRRKPQ